MSFIVMIIALTILSMIKTLRLFTISIIIYFLGATFLNSGLQNSLLKFGEKKKVEGISRPCRHIPHRLCWIRYGRSELNPADCFAFQSTYNWQFPLCRFHSCQSKVSFPNRFQTGTKASASHHPSPAFRRQLFPSTFFS